MADISSWATTVGDFVNKIGIPSVIVIFMLLVIGGIIPSVFTNQQNEILLVVRQIRTISASVAGMRHAECVNKADVDAGSDPIKFTRMAQRCSTAYDELRRALENIGAEATGKTTIEVKPQ